MSLNKIKDDIIKEYEFHLDNPNSFAEMSRSFYLKDNIYDELVQEFGKNAILHVSLSTEPIEGSYSYKVNNLYVVFNKVV